jgi:hypothetical protein
MASRGESVNEEEIKVKGKESKEKIEEKGVHPK